jgi:CRISPR/Cas system-associated endonuclease/helicase Cas3
MSYNPYRPKAIQNQQKTQPKPQGKPQQQRQQKIQIKDGFDPELLGRDVEAEVVKGMSVVVIRGKVEDVSKYWLKLLVNNEVIHLNKAFVISIKPLIIKNGGVGMNGGEQPSRPR